MQQMEDSMKEVDRLIIDFMTVVYEAEQQTKYQLDQIIEMMRGDSWIIKSNTQVN